ncbi:MAG: hypothetical protein LBT32_07020 [Peptococcaceae bacterium]|jgi:hypothetical protein|nr:hypothetical protein [Peptococcaceae bacterium]
MKNRLFLTTLILTAALLLSSCAAPPALPATSSLPPVEQLMTALRAGIDVYQEEISVAVRGLTTADLDLDPARFPQVESWHCTYSSLGDALIFNQTFTIRYKPGYKISYAHHNSQPEILSEHELETYREALRVLESLHIDDMTDYHKELAIHDYIIETCVYDEDNVVAGTIQPESSEPYGVLLNHMAVCQGYSETFRLFMDMLDIKCEIIQGIAHDQLHAWNRVQLDGAWYLVDTTWDDPVGQQLGDLPHHTYFNVTDAQLAGNHTPNEPYTPECTMTQYNYFVYNDLIVASQTDFEHTAQQAVRAGQTEFSAVCDGISFSELDLESLFRFFNRYAYSFDDDMRIITVYLK